MPLCDAVASSACDTAKSVWVSGRDAAHVLLLQCPARLDRVEVRRVGRQVDDAHAASSAGRTNSWVVMGTQVVHDDDIAASELGQQLVFYPGYEAILVRRGEHARQNDPSGQADRSEHGEVRAPVHRDPVDEFFATLKPRVAPAHREIHPRLVEEHQPVDGHAADLPQERRALDDDVRPQTLQRPSALFFTT